jgi:inosose dehydratase
MKPVDAPPPARFIVDRRHFTCAVASAGLASLWAAPLIAYGKAAKATTGARDISFGYATLTWGDDNARTAITQVAEAGFRGVQIRSQSLPRFGSPEELKAVLAKAGLAFVCLSGGAPPAEAAARTKAVETFCASASFARAAGAMAVQATAPAHGPGKVAVADLKSFARTLTEIGKRTMAMGMPLGFHPSANQYGRTEDELSVILEASDPRYVKLLLDTGHHAAAGGDVAGAIRKHARRLLLVHLKDVKLRPAPDGSGDPYEFVELGQGDVDFKAVFDALLAIKFKGWAVVEMRPYSVKEGHSARDGALANKAFLENVLGQSV